ncbi:MAG: DUF397 domain-containing protein [Alphaproteobacteria bacterium]|jgi:hypothetical protein|nr:DUF397 domain-containing protein [Alphaproteobacteria bacterium]
MGSSQNSTNSFKTSSFCSEDCCCVGVKKDGETFVVTNTTGGQPEVKFTQDEWEAFIKGVKNGEFDPEKL